MNLGQYQRTQSLCIVRVDLQRLAGPPMDLRNGIRRQCTSFNADYAKAGYLGGGVGEAGIQLQRPPSMTRMRGSKSA